MNLATLSERFGVGKQAIRKKIKKLGLSVRREGRSVILDKAGVETLRRYYASEVRNSHVARTRRR